MDDQRVDYAIGENVSVLRFSFKRLLVSIALIAAACQGCAIIIYNNVPNPFGAGGAIGLLLGVGMCFGAGIFNLLGKPLIGALAGAWAALMLLLLLILVR